MAVRPFQQDGVDFPVQSGCPVFFGVEFYDSIRRFNCSEKLERGPAVHARFAGKNDQGMLLVIQYPVQKMLGRFCS